MKIALVHDDLVQAGGAERVVAALHEMYPHAPLFTSVYDPKTTLPVFAEMDIHTSYLQKWPVARRRWHKLALLQYPAAFEQFDFSGYDVALSSCSRFAKGIITRPETCHICYCYTPPRFAWRPQDYAAQNPTARLLAPLLRNVMRELRAWDLDSAQRVDYFIATSFNVARRILKHYRRPVAAIIPPPVQTSRFCPAPSSEVGSHFLVVSRLIGYKAIGLAVEACNSLGAELRIIGTGPELSALRRQAGPTIQFLGQCSDRQVASEYARCRALIFPGEEDFGLTPLECMASGRPVVAFAAGGALETVIEGETGVFFREQTVQSLIAALKTVTQLTFTPHLLRAHSLQYDSAVFDSRIRQFVECAAAQHQCDYESLQVGMAHEPKMPTEYGLHAEGAGFYQRPLRGLRVQPQPL